jgi:guanylate kinase
MSHWDEFDYVIFNDDLDQAVADLEAVLAGRGTKSATTNPVVRNAAEALLRE